VNQGRKRIRKSDTFDAWVWGDQGLVFFPA
jgi:hypothetical protein